MSSAEKLYSCTWTNLSEGWRNIAVSIPTKTTFTPITITSADQATGARRASSANTRAETVVTTAARSGVPLEDSSAQNPSQSTGAIRMAKCG